MTAEAIVLAILAIFPAMSGNNRACIEHNIPRIAAQLQESADAQHVPMELMAAVGFSETHLGCDAHEGGNWGAPISRNARHTAGTHMHAAVALRVSFDRCGTWDGAVMRFRTGLCNPSTSPSSIVRYQGPRYLRNVNSLAARIRVTASRPRSALPSAQ